MISAAEQLEATAVLVRRLAAQGHYEKLQVLLQEYGDALAGLVADLPADDEHTRWLAERWRRLLHETRRTVLAGRAHAATRLARCAKLPAAYIPGPPARRTWQYSA